MGGTGKTERSAVTERVLGVDPSSSHTGYAVLDGPEVLIDCGVLRPNRDADPPLLRIETMITELQAVVAEHEPDVAVVEVTSGKISRRIKRFQPSGLPVYGMAVGAVWRELVVLMDGAVVAVAENEWTGGVPKYTRRLAVCSQFPQYAQGQTRDPGADAADAIGLAQWYLAKRKL